jgi:hypothetical protein
MPEEHTDSIRSWAQTLDGVNKRTGKNQRTDTTQRNQTRLT